MKRIRFNENQLALDFTERKSISLGYEDREKAFWFLSGIGVLSLLAYFYAINAIAHNTATRSNLEAHLADASGKVAALEFSYIDLQNNITKEQAIELGFKDAKTPLYVSKTPATALTLNR